MAGGRAAKKIPGIKGDVIPIRRSALKGEKTPQERKALRMLTEWHKASKKLFLKEYFAGDLRQS